MNKTREEKPRKPERKRKKWRSGAIVLVSGFVGMCIGALLFAFLAGGIIYDYEDTVQGDSLPPVDAIVCLAGGKGRIPVAADPWFRYWNAVQAEKNAEPETKP